MAIEWIPYNYKSGKVAGGGYKSRVNVFHNEDYECAFCKGTGEKPSGTKCSVCRGKGVNKVRPPTVICAFCRGRGALLSTPNITCGACRGKGVVTVREPVDICPSCGGRGRKSGEDLYCISCKGTGVITRK